jgi:site-specific recombinase XerD
MYWLFLLQIFLETIVTKLSQGGKAMNLYKRANGFWYVDYERDGRRVQQTTKTKSKAQALLFLTNLKEKQNPAVSITLSNFLEEYINFSKVNKARRATEMDQRGLNALLRVLGNKKISSFSVGDIEKFKSSRLNDVSKTSVNIELRTCKAAFNIAMKWNYIDTNPFSQVKLFKVPQKGREYFRTEEITALLQNIPQRWFYDVIAFALNTGCRKGEIVNLKWEDVDLKRKEIFIRHNDSFTVKGGNERVIPMNDLVFEILSNKSRLSDFVLTNASGGKLCSHYIWKRFKRIVVNSGLDPKFHFHHLRHTFATTLIQQGVPIYEVQKLLGHSKVSTTEIYAHMSVETLRSSVAVLDSLMKVNS